MSTVPAPTAPSGPPRADEGVEEEPRAPGEARNDVLLFVLLLGAYLLTGATTLQGTDHGEWMALALHGGIGHPPGYPLYALLLHAWNALPLPLSPVMQASALSAVLMAAAMVALARALEERSGHPFTTRIAVVALALAPPTWRIAGLAEVTPLLALNAALLLWAMHYVDNEIELLPRHGAVLGALLGVGVVHHHSLVLLAPLFGWHVVWSHRKAGAKRWIRATLAGVVTGTVVVAVTWAVALGVVAASPGAVMHARVESLSDGWDVLLRREYGTLSSSALSAGWSWRASVDLLRDFSWAYHFMIPMGLAALQVKRGWPPLVTVLLAGPWLVGTFTTAGAGGEAVPVPLEFRERFHVLPLMVFALMIHDALASLAYQLPRLRRTVFIRAQAGLLFIAMAVSAMVTLSDASWKGESAHEHVLRTAVRTLPADAVVVVVGDAWQFGWPVASELAGVDGSRRTVLGWPRSWSRPPARGDVPPVLAGGCAPACTTGEDIAADLHRIAAAGPVYLFPAQAAGTVVPADAVAVEGLFSVLRKDPPSLEQQAAALDAFMKGNPAPMPAGTARRNTEMHALACWSAPWLVLSDAASRAGQVPLAAEAARRARAVMSP